MGAKGKKILLILILSALGLSAIYQSFRVNQLKDRIEMVNPSTAAVIQQGLVQLEMEIVYQKAHDWNSAEQLVLLIRNVQEGIRGTIETGQYARTLSDQERDTLWSLYMNLNTYIENKGTHDLTLDEESKKSFERLEAKLRTNGWGSNIGFSSDWTDFMRRTTSFLSS